MRSMLQSFTVEGLNLERLIRQTTERGITLLGMRRLGGRRMTGCVEQSQLSVLISLAQEGGWEIRPGGARGLARVVAMLRRRWLLCALCVLVLAAAGAASAVMWRVSLIDAGAYEAEIRQYLMQAGVAPPMWKSRVDVPALRDALEWRYPRIAWIDCGWRGGALQIRVVEGAQGEDPVDLTGCTDVVASRAGVVVSVVTLAGTAQVRSGQTVTAGETLILGEERGADGSVHPVAARGEVLARVWDGASVRVSGMGVETTLTGREHTSMQAVTPWFPLWQEESSPYDEAEITQTVMPLGGLFLPVAIRRITRAEAVQQLIPVPQEELMAQASAVATRKLHEKLGFTEEFVDKWVDYSMIENGDIVAVAIAERIIDIAQRGESP